MTRMALSRSSVVAMMRGVYWPPATWIATSSEPKVKTRNDSFIVIEGLMQRLRPVPREPGEAATRGQGIEPPERRSTTITRKSARRGSDPERRSHVADGAVDAVPRHVALDVRPRRVPIGGEPRSRPTTSRGAGSGMAAIMSQQGAMQPLVPVFGPKASCEMTPGKTEAAKIPGRGSVNALRRRGHAKPSRCLYTA